MANTVVTQRLIGAIVVVSLAVIFIPMFLGGEGELAGIIQKTNIPPEPVYEFQTFAPADKGSMVQEVEQVMAPKIVESDVDVLAQKAPAVKTEPTPKKPSPAKTSRKPTSKPQAQPPENVTALRENRDKVLKPATSSSHVQSWSVQVASFKEKSRALSLRDKLRAKKYVAYVESIKLPKSISYRVKVGPELNRNNAESLQKQLKKQMQLSGIVVQH